VKTISEHEGLFWVADESGRKLIKREKAIGLLYTAEAECDASVVDRVMLAAEVAGQREAKKRGE
jgi:hypothetical protein